ncbi:MAG: DNA mismatch repair protein MutS [bacterium]|nr:DNA mismatch repair protein MutS [bacterium]
MAKENDGLTPMMRQYRRTKEELDNDTILFFRMGDFYEMFFEDAHRAAPLLGVAITKRAGVPMCGVPYHAIDGYLAKVIRAGLKAAVCEQVEDPKATKGIVRREITRIVTPGTVTEEAILDAQRANYLAAVYVNKKDLYGIAVLELSTGELAVETAESPIALIEALRRISPSETLLSDEQAELLSPLLCHEITGAVTTTEGWRFMLDQASDELCHHFHVHSLEGYCGSDVTPLWVNAAGALLHYVRHELRHPVDHVRTLNVRNNGAYLTLDECTCRNLDLLPTPGGRPEAETLLGVLDGTCTSMGKRLLRAWIRSPLREVETIHARQAAVQVFIDRRRLLSDLRTTLSNTHDFERVMTRLSAGSGNGRDLRQLCDSLLQIPAIRAHLNDVDAPLLKSLSEALTDLPELSHELSNALEDTPPLTLKEGGIIRPGYNAELDGYREAASQGHTWIANYQAQQQEATGIRTLRVRRNNVFGFYIEVSKGQLANVPASYERRQTVVNAERFITPELKEYEQKIFGAQDKANALEYELFQQLRNKAVAHLAMLQQIATAVAQIDVLQGFADRALAQTFRCPTVNDSFDLNIRGGRHPMVEAQRDAERFVPNDTQMNGEDRQFILITGPNMAGKSTYIRQVAVLAIMAHIGSFVPADEMTIGCIDRVFTRVGAGDDLARGRSTFMVEMQEAANILNNATPRSLIVLDEIGRGTSTFDGISIAWSVVEYLHNTPERKARTLFATHYHELTALAAALPGVRNYTVQVREQGDTIVFLRRIVPGTADKSYGIHVARLAGMPDAIVCRAQNILSNLEENKAIQAELPRPRRRSTPRLDNSHQLDLFEC